MDTSPGRDEYVRLLDLLEHEGFNYAGEVTGYLTLRDQTLRVEEGLKMPPDPATRGTLAEWLAEPGYISIELTWHTNDRQYASTLIEMWEGVGRASIQLAIDDAIFLPGTTIEFTPDELHGPFASFRQVVIELCRQLQPVVAVIDAEADLLCDSLYQVGSLVSWGTYFSQQILDGWALEDRQQLQQAADEHIETEGLGTLIFIHPLAANQAWTSRHEKVHRLLQRYSLPAGP
jgi:hypothetical protein